MAAVEYHYAWFDPFGDSETNWNGAASEIIGNVHENPELLAKEAA